MMGLLTLTRRGRDQSSFSVCHESIKQSTDRRKTLTAGPVLLDSSASSCEESVWVVAGTQFVVSATET
jgi:hypothetical protein